jgi:hypothetical protein
MASPQRPVPPPPRPPPPPPIRPPSPGPPWRHWNTLQKLWASIFLIWALDGLLLLTVVKGAQVHRDAAKSIGKDTAPSIIHAQHIKTALADMDANVANELLGEPGKMKADVNGYEDQRRTAGTALIEAAKNITFDEKEQKPIEDLQFAMGIYEARVQQARDLHQRGEAAVNAYLDAARVMDEQLLPKADELDRVDRQRLDDSYDPLNSRSTGSAFVVLLVGAAILWALFAVQRFLNQRTHRILNPMLLASTLVTLAFILYTFTTFSSERKDLRVATKDAFDSIHALLRAQAVAYAASADESRYLLDTAHAREHESAFASKSDALAKLPAGMTFANVIETAQQEKKVEGATGELVTELNNITFEGERELAVKTVAKFGEYLKGDGDIRRLQQSGKHAEAVQLCISAKNGGAFEEFDKALGKTVDINQTAFDDAVGRAFDALSYFELKASIIALTIALLAFFGLLQRIQEYR